MAKGGNKQDQLNENLGMFYGGGPNMFATSTNGGKTGALPWARLDPSVGVAGVGQAADSTTQGLPTGMARPGQTYTPATKAQNDAFSPTVGKWSPASAAQPSLSSDLQRQLMFDAMMSRMYRGEQGWGLGGRRSGGNAR